MLQISEYIYSYLSYPLDFFKGSYKTCSTICVKYVETSCKFLGSHTSNALV